MHPYKTTPLLPSLSTRCPYPPRGLEACVKEGKPFPPSMNFVINTNFFFLKPRRPGGELFFYFFLKDSLPVQTPQRRRSRVVPPHPHGSFPYPFLCWLRRAGAPAPPPHPPPPTPPPPHPPPPPTPPRSRDLRHLFPTNMLPLFLSLGFTCPPLQIILFSEFPLSSPWVPPVHTQGTQTGSTPTPPFFNFENS